MIMGKRSIQTDFVRPRSCVLRAAALEVLAGSFYPRQN